MRPSCRRQYGAFLSDILLSEEKENKALEGEIQNVFSALSVEAEEQPSAAEGFAHPGQYLCEQVRAGVPVQVGLVAAFLKYAKNLPKFGVMPVNSI